MLSWIEGVWMKERKGKEIEDKGIRGLIWGQQQEELSYSSTGNACRYTNSKVLSVPRNSPFLIMNYVRPAKFYPSNFSLPSLPSYRQNAYSPIRFDHLLMSESDHLQHKVTETGTSIENLKLNNLDGTNGNLTASALRFHCMRTRRTG